MKLQACRMKIHVLQLHPWSLEKLLSSEVMHYSTRLKIAHGTVSCIYQDRDADGSSTGSNEDLSNPVEETPLLISKFKDV